MDDERFDAMTRSVASGTSSRRAALRLLAGTGLGLLTARIALAEDVGATRKKRRQRSEARHDGALQAEGKGKGKKGKGKGKKKPPQPRDCGPNMKPCPDGGCVHQALCCPGQRMCAGERCQIGCCDDEWECADGSCVPHGECCDGERPCDGDVCISANQCCPNEKRCEGEAGCFPLDECCGGDTFPLCPECYEEVCDGGEWACRRRCDCGPDATVCRPGYEQDPSTCACRCPDGSVNCGFFCCPAGGACLGGEGFRTWCQTASGAIQCPIGWTPYRDSGLCYPGNPPS